jgi:hypothetical protein
MDWEVKLWKPNFTNYVTVAKHDDFVTSIDSNNYINPFLLASADCEGGLLVQRLCNGSKKRNIFKWNADLPISKVRWSP